MVINISNFLYILSISILFDVFVMKRKIHNFFEFVSLPIVYRFEQSFPVLVTTIIENEFSFFKICEQVIIK